MYKRRGFCVYIIPLVLVLVTVYSYRDELNIFSWLNQKEQRQPSAREMSRLYCPTFPSPGGNVKFNAIETRFHLD